MAICREGCGDLPLHLSFPVVYGIAINREASVASSLEQLGTAGDRGSEKLEGSFT